MRLFDRYNQISLPIILGLFLLSGLCTYLWIDKILIADFDDSLREQSQKISGYLTNTGKFPSPGFADEWHISFQSSNTKVIKPTYTTVPEFDEEDRAFVKYRELTFTCKANNKYYLVKVSKSMEALAGLSRSIASISMITMLVVIVVTLLLSQLLLKKLWRPFYNALELLKNFKLGSNHNLKFGPTKTDEFAFMNNRLNSMIANAENEYVLLKEFTENASHELQTPLSIIRSKLDTIVQGENLSEVQSAAMESAYQAIHRLVNLNQSLLLLSKIENHQYHDIRKINIKEKVTDKLWQLEEFWLEKKLIVQSEIQEAYIIANPDLVDILLNNVLSNASRHNIFKGKININLTGHQLIVSNTGTDKPIDPSRIFSRFYKQEQHSSNNNGLGLSIIKQIGDQAGIVIKYTFESGLHIFSFSWA